MAALAQPAAVDMQLKAHSALPELSDAIDVIAATEALGPHQAAC